MKQLYEMRSYLYKSEKEMKEGNKKLTHEGFKVTGKSRDIENDEQWIVYYEKFIKGDCQ